MTPLEAGVLFFTGITAAVTFYAFKNISTVKDEWPYSVLGVRSDSTIAEVKQAYRELVKRFHPDRLPANVPPEIRKAYEEELIRINNAYKTILSLREQTSPRLKVDQNEIQEIRTLIEKAENTLKEGGNVKDVVLNGYLAAERMVYTLYKAAVTHIKEVNYYDALTELMVNDFLTLDDFNVLAEARRARNMVEKETPNLREAFLLVRRINQVYLKILHRYIDEKDE